MTNAIAKLDFAKAQWSALFMYTETDKVVKPWLIDRVFNAWGGRKTKLIVEVGEHDDPNSHVICGDIMSPSMNDYFVDKIVDWATGKYQ